MNENDAAKTEKDLGSQMLGDELMFGSVFPDFYFFITMFVLLDSIFKSSQTLRRLSKSFEAIEAANRDAREFSSEDEETKDNESEEDQIQLGEEGFPFNFN